jgi:hypothetical protein
MIAFLGKTQCTELIEIILFGKKFTTSQHSANNQLLHNMKRHYLGANSSPWIPHFKSDESSLHYHILFHSDSFYSGCFKKRFAMEIQLLLSGDFY